MGLVERSVNPAFVPSGLEMRQVGIFYLWTSTSLCLRPKHLLGLGVAVAGACVEALAGGAVEVVLIGFAG